MVIKARQSNHNRDDIVVSYVGYHQHNGWSIQVDQYGKPW